MKREGGVSSGPAVSYDYKRIDELISEQCGKSPDRTAAVFYGKTMTYRQLDTAANRVARFLLENGLREKQTVSVVSDRCPELLPVILAILKCGAVYVPVDSAYPEKRVRYILENAGSKIVIDLTNGKSGMLPVGTGTATYTPAELPFRSGYESRGVRCTGGTDGPAYIIYTSGTTGKPKGVVVSHKAIANTLLWMNDVFRPDAGDTIAFKTSISFTDSIWELFFPLVNGAKLSIVNNDDVRSPKALYRFLLENDVTYTQFVPSIFRLFIKYVGTLNTSDPLPRLKWIFNGGEQLNINLAKKFYSLIGSARIANIYGMTESAVYATCHVLGKNTPDGLSSIPSGKPISNTTVCILNEAGELCGVGEEGEIGISGPGLAEGYWKSPELTAEKFLRGKLGFGTIYKTGDTGMIDGDGCLWYRGRLDGQVKIRGNRVELSEVENSALEFDGIEQAAAVSKENPLGEKYLVLFLVGKIKETSALRSFLMKTLPDYMMPQRFVFLKSMPLTVNKKIDRAALGKMDTGGQSGPLERVSRSSGNCGPDKTVHDIFSMLLCGRQFGDDDNFYDIGGDSIMLAMLQIELEKAGFPLDYKILSENMTVHRIAELLKPGTDKAG